MFSRKEKNVFHLIKIQVVLISSILQTRKEMFEFPGETSQAADSNVNIQLLGP